jgi:hypothetical protein
MIAKSVSAASSRLFGPRCAGKDGKARLSGALELTDPHQNVRK